MNKESFWIFLNLGLGDAICANAIFRHYAKLHEEKLVVIVCWEHNLASIQWLLSDCLNVYFYPIETEQQLLTCRDSIRVEDRLCLGFYDTGETIENYNDLGRIIHIKPKDFNPVLWDSEFYRQASLPASLKWEGFRLPELDSSGEKFRSFIIDAKEKTPPYLVVHQDAERGFGIPRMFEDAIFLDKTWSLKSSCRALSLAYEIHCIDSSILNLVDLMPTPHKPKLVFHKYARKGLPPSLRKPWEILD